MHGNRHALSWGLPWFAWESPCLIIKIYMDVVEWTNCQMENACTLYAVDSDMKTGQKNFDTGLDRRVEGPCDLMYIEMRSLDAMADVELSKLVDKVLQLAKVA